MDVVVVSMPGPGRGHRKKHNPERRCEKPRKEEKTMHHFHQKRRCLMLRLRNRHHAFYCHKDQGVDGFHQWYSLEKGYPVLQRQAQELHQQAGVVEGPCGLPELRQFQHALGSQYQLLVMTRMKPFFLTCKGPAAPH